MVGRRVNLQTGDSLMIQGMQGEISRIRAFAF